MFAFLASSLWHNWTLPFPEFVHKCIVWVHIGYSRYCTSSPVLVIFFLTETSPSLQVDYLSWLKNGLKAHKTCRWAFEEHWAISQLLSEWDLKDEDEKVCRCICGGTWCQMLPPKSNYQGLSHLTHKLCDLKKVLYSLWNSISSRVSRDNNNNTCFRELMWGLNGYNRIVFKTMAFT